MKTYAHRLKITALFGLLIVAAPIAALAADRSDRLVDRVIALEGKTKEARKGQILKFLHELDVPHRLQAFPLENGKEGENVVVTFPGKGKRIVLGAHYDKVAESPGAVDNGSGCSILIEIIADIKENPVNHPVDIVFFDAEEHGFGGSRCYVSEVDSQNVLGYINLDVCGYGDTVFWGPVGQDDADDRVVRTVWRATVKERAPSLALEWYPPTDNISFERAGISNVSLAVLPVGEAKQFAEFLAGRAEAMPRILTIIDTPADTHDNLEGDAMDLLFRVARTTIRLLDSPEIPSQEH